MADSTSDLRIRIVPRATVALVVLCAAVYAYEVLRFGWSPTAPELHLIGGLSKGALEVGHWWSLVLGNLLHASLDHVLLNMVVIFHLGWFVEWAWGARVMLLVLVAGVIGSDIAGIVFHPELTAIGASGMLAALVGFGLAQPPRQGIQVFVLRMIGIRVAIFGLLDYVVGRASGDVDAVNNAAHLGGLGGGALVAFLLWVPWLRSGRGLVAIRRAGLAIACVALVASAIGAASHIAEVNSYAWTGAGSERPDALPPADLLELTLDGIALDALGAVRDPSCEVDGDAVAAECEVRIIEDDRATSIDVNRSDIHLDFRFVERSGGGDSARDDAGELDGAVGDLPNIESEEGAALLVRQSGVDVGAAAPMRLGRVSCKVLNGDLARCQGFYLDQVVSVTVRYVGGVGGVTLNEQSAIAYPATSAQVTAAIEGLVVPGIGEDIALTRVRGCELDGSVSTPRSWLCSDTVLDDGAAHAVPFRFGTDGKFIGGGGFMYPAIRFRPVRPEVLADVARAVPRATSGALERSLVGMELDRVNGRGRRVVDSAACAASGEFATPAPDFGCTLEFEGGGFAAVYVEPGRVLQIEPVSPALGTAVEYSK